MKKLLGVLALLPLAACIDPPQNPPADAGDGDEDPVQVQCTEPEEVECQDQSIQQLALFDTVNNADITEEEGGPAFTHHVDATAGGLNPNTSYVYAKFTDDGLVKVDIDDETAFQEMGWDIAFRRFVIRLNSGVSGPSCVAAARTAANTTFDELDAVPEGLTFREEEYFDPDASCELVPDGSGLGSPGVVLQNYWRYPGCVAMTGNVYVLQLADGRHVKLEVLSYYEQGQEDCNQDDPSGISGGGNLRVRWAFLD